MQTNILAGRTALVTGGATGIGAGIAAALAQVGARVMIADIAVDAAHATAAELPGDGHDAVALDVTEDAAWESAVATMIDRFGGFDVLVNNAGIEISSLLIDVRAEDLRRMCDVNVLGTALGLKHAFRAMRPGGAAGAGGAVLNIASVAATIAFPGIAGYSGTKSAVDRITRIAAAESGRLGYGVRVNCLYPGLIPNRMGTQLASDCVEMGLFPSIEAAVGSVIALTPAGRLGEVADMADAAVFLLSDQARFITGTGLSVDGGMGS